MPRPVNPEIVSVAPALTLKRGFLWVLAGNGCYAASQSLMLIVLARLSTPAIVGRYTLALSITAPIILLSNLQLRVVQATDARHDFHFSDYSRLRFITSVGALLVVCGVAFGFGYSRESAVVILAVGFSKIIESFSDIVFGLFQRNERLEFMSMSLIIKGPATLVAIASAMYLTGSLLVAVLAICSVWLAMLLFFDIPNAKRFLSRHRPELPWNLPLIGRLAMRALPLGFVSMLISLNWNLSRYFLERSHGEEALGYFAAMAYIPIVGMFVVEAIGQAAIPRLAKYYCENRPAYLFLLLKLLAVVAVAGLAGVAASALFGETLLRILYGPAYARNANVLVWIVISAALLYVCSILGVALTAARHLKAQVPIHGAVIATSLVGSMLLVLPYGLRGAAWTMVISNSVWVLLASAVLWREVRRPVTSRSAFVSSVSGA